MLHEAILESEEKMHLFNTALEGVINVIPKPNRDSKKIHNLRPITLCNSDYKVVEKIIANRMIK